MDILRDPGILVFFCYMCGNLLYIKRKITHQEFFLTEIHTPQDSEPFSGKNLEQGKSCQERFLQRSQGLRAKK